MFSYSTLISASSGDRSICLSQIHKTQIENTKHTAMLHSKISYENSPCFVFQNPFEIFYFCEKLLRYCSFKTEYYCNGWKVFRFKSVIHLKYLMHFKLIFCSRFFCFFFFFHIYFWLFWCLYRWSFSAVKRKMHSNQKYKHLLYTFCCINVGPLAFKLFLSISIWSGGIWISIFPAFPTTNLI